MDRKPLREPKTPQDEYLHDMASSLRDIHDHLVGTPDGREDGTVQLREPAVDLDGMTRDQLDQHARRVGVSEPQALPNKDAVKTAIREAS